ncbi:hypothetical protein EON83_21625 [bacterium]|nr:MAG: hypothetical protein EON83_21625 [bacterium]
MKIASLLALLGALLCASVVPTHAQNQPTAPAPTQDAWKMPDEEKEQWFQTLKRLVGNTNWIVSIRDNDFIIEYNEPVAFSSSNTTNPSLFKGFDPIIPWARHHQKNYCESLCAFRLR